MFIRGTQAFCSRESFIEYSVKNVKQLAKKGEKIQAKTFALKKKVFKGNDIRLQLKLTQKSFNRMRVLQELDWFYQMGQEPTCISCGGTLGNDQWCCGHFKTQGGNSRIRFDEINTALQHNHRCNMNLSGDIEGTHNTHGYKQGLINRYGETGGKAIIEYCEENTGPKKWECDELEAMRKSFNQRIRVLEQRMDKAA
jgi:hypothetical protein